MTTTNNHETKISTLDTKKTFNSVTSFTDGFSLKGTTQLDEFIFIEDMILIKGTTLYKKNPLYKEIPLKGITLIREIAIEQGEVFLKGSTYINDGIFNEGTTLIRHADFNRVYLLDRAALVRCLA